jgi:hypothetical protein
LTVLIYNILFTIKGYYMNGFSKELRLSGW